MNALALQVILVDDNEDYRRLLRWALTSAMPSVSIEEMTSGEELLNWLTAQPSQQVDERLSASSIVRVILLDLHMPGLSGLETLQAIGTMSNLAYMPVVMLTASINERVKQQAYEQGIHLYMVKPIGPGGLYRVVEAVKLCYHDTLRMLEQSATPRISFR